MDSIYGDERQKLGIQQPLEMKKQWLSLETGILILAVLLPVIVFFGRASYRHSSDRGGHEEIANVLAEPAKISDENRQSTPATESDTPTKTAPPVEVAQIQQLPQETSGVKAAPQSVNPLNRPQQPPAIIDSRAPSAIPNTPIINQQRFPPSPVESRASPTVPRATMNLPPRGTPSLPTGRSISPQNNPAVVSARQLPANAIAPVLSPGNAPTATNVPAINKAAANNTPIANNVSVASNNVAAANSQASIVTPSGAIVSYPSLPPAARPGRLMGKPITVVANPKLEQLLSEAWGLIERGDYEPGRFRLLEARKVNREDPRIDFSLGLLDGLINHDWLSAEKRFADCVRRYPENVPMLNNLAIAQLHNRREMEAVKRWKAIVDMNAANAEVVQNLGRARQLLEQGVIRRTASLVKALDELYTDAAVATSQSFQGKSGFIVMSMQLADGRIVGWVNARKMEDSSPFGNVAGTSRATPSQAVMPMQAQPVPDTAKPGSTATGTNDPRVRYPSQYPAGVTGRFVPPGGNMPATSLPNRKR
jgi:hypothetical protein